jgi:hypothetical protein
MNYALIFFMLTLTACAGGNMDRSVGGLSTSFDGRYDGTGQTTRIGCANGQPVPVTLHVEKGRATILLSRGRSITADVAPDGRLKGIVFTNPTFPGSSWGTGRITDTSFEIELSTLIPNQRSPCTYRYGGERAA